MDNISINAVYGLNYCSPEEIAAEFDNGQQVLESCKGMSKIPVRLLQFVGDHEDVYFMLVAGEGALYPWKRGQLVSASFVGAFIERLRYLRDMVVNGIDNSKYQQFCLYDEIIPVKSGEYFPEEGAKKFLGLYSYDLFKQIADEYYDDSL